MNQNNELQNCLLSNFCNLITVRLDDTNYITWRFMLESMLVGCDLMGYIDGSVPSPPQYKITTEVGITPELTQEYKVWRKHDSALMTLLVGTLSSDALSFIVGSQTSKEVWFSLEERYGKLSKFKAFDLKISMQQIQKGNDSIDKYMQRIKTVRDQLFVAGVYIPDEDIVTLILNGLPADYTTIKIVIRACKTPISLSELRTMLLDVESDVAQESKQIDALGSNIEKHTRTEARHYHCGSYGTHLTAQVAHAGTSSFNGLGDNDFEGLNGYGLSNGFRNSPEVCQICNNKGYTAQVCSQRSSPRTIIASGTYMQCQICMKTGHSAAECLHRHNYNFQPTTYVAAQDLTASFSSQPLPASNATKSLLLPMDSEVGLAGIQKCKEGFTALSTVLGIETEYENLLDVKKKQLLGKVAATLVPTEKKVNDTTKIDERKICYPGLQSGTDVAALQLFIPTQPPLMSNSPSMISTASFGISNHKASLYATQVSSNLSEWQQAMLKEIEALSPQGTWQLPSNPQDSSSLHCRQAFHPMVLCQSLPLVNPG